MRAAVAVVVAALLVAGCGSSSSAVERDLRRGEAQIRHTRDAKKLRSELRGTLARLRRDRPSGPAEGRARVLAIRGVEAALRGVQSRIDFMDNDSGNVAAATRDAVRADRGMAKAARLLRAAERALDAR
jgi:hypothetical protein